MKHSLLSLACMSCICMFCIFMIASGNAVSETADNPLELAVMTTSDLYGHVVPFNSSPGEPLLGGLDRISALAKSIRSETDGSVLLSSGDDMMGAFYEFYGGEPEMKAMTLAGYDAACPGNHEFDMGWPLYRNATRHAGFPILCANLKIEDPLLRAAIRPSVLLNISGVLIGLFGLMTPDLDRLTRTDESLSVNNSIEEIASEQVRSLRGQGADLIIAISHMGAALDEDLAENVSGIDLIVGGHDHTYINTSIDSPDGHRTLIVQDGTSGERMGVLRFTYSGRDRGIENPLWETVPLNESAGYDPAVRAYLVPFVEDFQKRLSLEIGSAAVALDAREATVRDREAPLGNLITDSWLAWFPEVDIAAINAGGIREDRIYPAGPISYLMLQAILPFGNDLVLVNMTGGEIRQMLEISAAALDPEVTGVNDGGFLQVSGIRFRIDRDAQPFSATYDDRSISEMKSPGERVSDVYVLCNGTWEPLDDEMRYDVVLSSWIAGGGDGYYLFVDMPEERKYNTTVKDLGPVAVFIKENSPVAPMVEGRIEIVGS